LFSATRAQLGFDLKPHTTQRLKPPSTAVRTTPEKGSEVCCTPDCSTRSQAKTSIASWPASRCLIPPLRRCMSVLDSSRSEYFGRLDANSAAIGMSPGRKGRYDCRRSWQFELQSTQPAARKIQHGCVFPTPRDSNDSQAARKRSPNVAAPLKHNRLLSQLHGHHARKADCIEPRSDPAYESCSQ